MPGNMGSGPLMMSSIPTKILFMGKLPADVNEKMITDQVKSCGKILDIKFVIELTEANEQFHVAFVEFPYEACAVAAYQTLIKANVPFQLGFAIPVPSTCVSICGMRNSVAKKTLWKAINDPQICCNQVKVHNTEALVYFQKCSDAQKFVGKMCGLQKKDFIKKMEQEDGRVLELQTDTYSRILIDFASEKFQQYFMERRNLAARGKRGFQIHGHYHCDHDNIGQSLDLESRHMDIRRVMSSGQFPRGPQPPGMHVPRNQGPTGLMAQLPHVGSSRKGTRNMAPGLMGPRPMVPPPVGPRSMVPPPVGPRPMVPHSKGPSRGIHSKNLITLGQPPPVGHSSGSPSHPPQSTQVPFGGIHVQNAGQLGHPPPAMHLSGDPGPTSPAAQPFPMEPYGAIPAQTSSGVGQPATHVSGYASQTPQTAQPSVMEPYGGIHAQNSSQMGQPTTYVSGYPSQAPQATQPLVMQPYGQNPSPLVQPITHVSGYPSQAPGAAQPYVLGSSGGIPAHNPSQVGQASPAVHVSGYPTHPPQSTQPSVIWPSGGIPVQNPGPLQQPPMHVLDYPSQPPPAVQTSVMESPGAIPTQNPSTQGQAPPVIPKSSATEPSAQNPNALSQSAPATSQRKVNNPKEAVAIVQAILLGLKQKQPGLLKEAGIYVKDGKSTEADRHKQQYSQHGRPSHSPSPSRKRRKSSRSPARDEYSSKQRSRSRSSRRSRSRSRNRPVGPSWTRRNSRSPNYSSKNRSRSPSFGRSHRNRSPSLRSSQSPASNSHLNPGRRSRSWNRPLRLRWSRSNSRSPNSRSKNRSQSPNFEKFSRTGSGSPNRITEIISSRGLSRRRESKSPSPFRKIKVHGFERSRNRNRRVRKRKRKRRKDGRSRSRSLGRTGVSVETNRNRSTIETSSSHSGVRRDNTLERARSMRLNRSRSRSHSRHVSPRRNRLTRSRSPSRDRRLRDVSDHSETANRLYWSASSSRSRSQTPPDWSQPGHSDIVFSYDTGTWGPL